MSRLARAIAVVLAPSAFVLSPFVPTPTAAALEPPPTFCQLNPLKCHKLVGRTRLHFVGMLEQALRAVPRPPGYRCYEDRRIDKVGYGGNAARSAPEMISAFLMCVRGGKDPRKLPPDQHYDLEISVELSVPPTKVEAGGVREKENGPLVFTAPTSVSFVFGKVRERFPDLPGDVFRVGPYLSSAQVSIQSGSRATLDALARGLDRSAISALLAREQRRRKADHEFATVPYFDDRL